MTKSISGEGPTRNTLIVWLIAFVAVSFLVFISNLGTILTFKKEKPLRRRGVYCLINLAVADMIHGFFSMLWFMIYLDSIGIDFLPFKLTDRGLRITAGLVNTCTLVLSLFCLLLVSLDRVYATFYPFAYRAMSTSCFLKVFAVAWAASFIIAIMPAFYLEYTVYSHDVWYDNLNIVSMLCLGLNMLAYIAIFVKIRLHNLNHQQNQGQGEESVRRRERQERHLAITLLIVTILSLLTWLPFIINHKIEISSKEPLQTTKKYIELITELIQLSNSLVNPIVYFFRFRDFRKAMIRHFLPKCCTWNAQGVCGNENDIELEYIRNNRNKAYTISFRARNDVGTPEAEKNRTSITEVVNNK